MSMLKIPYFNLSFLCVCVCALSAFYNKCKSWAYRSGSCHRCVGLVYLISFVFVLFFF